MIQDDWQKFRLIAQKLRMNEITFSKFMSEKDIFFSKESGLTKLCSILNNQTVDDVDWALYILQNSSLNKETLNSIFPFLLRIAIDGSTRVMGEAIVILEGNYYKDESIKEVLKSISLEYRNIADDFVSWQIANTLKRLGFLDLLEDFLSFCSNHEDQKIKDFAVDFARC